MPGTPTGPRYSCIIPDPADRLSRMDRPPLGALDHRHADQPDPVLYQLAVTLLRRLGRSWIYRRVRKTADVQRICLATSDRHRILRTGVPRGTCQVPGISKTTQAVSIVLPGREVDTHLAIRFRKTARRHAQPEPNDSPLIGQSARYA